MSEKLFKLRFTGELYPYYRTVNYLLHILFYKIRNEFNTKDFINETLNTNDDELINLFTTYNTKVVSTNIQLIIDTSNQGLKIFKIELKELQYISQIFLENPEKIISNVWSQDDDNLSKHLLEKFEIVKLQNSLTQNNSNIFIYFYNQLDSGNKNLLYWYFNKNYAEEN